MSDLSWLEKNGWLRVLRPQVRERLGRLRHALFDFDGTLSALRQGWEDIMAPLMVDAICAGKPASVEIEDEVRAYIDRSTGILTIKQMEWLAEAVRRCGLNPEPLSAAEYKALYRRRVLDVVERRARRIANEPEAVDEMVIGGTRVFLEGLAQRGVTLYMASGSDHQDILAEAEILGLRRWFDGRIYGALDESEAHDKQLVIQRILKENHLSGDELLVVGDGPVEMRVAAACGAIALGVASDEIACRGWNERKVQRLEQAGADLLTPDFLHANEFLAFLFMDGGSAGLAGE